MKKLVNAKLDTVTNATQRVNRILKIVFEFVP